jgi:amidase
MTGEEVERSIFQWDRLRRTMLAFLEHRDLVISPACPYPAPPHGAERDEDFIYTLPYSLTGWPCAVVRAGSSPEGLPIGVQITARPWCDHVALAVAAHLEQEMGGWQQPPKQRASAPGRGL